MADDPYLWLENIDGEDALDWVRERNSATVAAVDGGDKPSDAFAACYAKCVAAEAKEVVEERNAFKKEEEEVEREEAEERAEEEGLAAAP